MSDNFINQLWKEYEAKAIHTEAGELQRKESKRCFFAGAHCLLGIMKTIIPELSDEEGEQMLIKIEKELQGFIIAVKLNIA